MSSYSMMPCRGAVRDVIVVHGPVTVGARWIRWVSPGIPANRMRKPFDVGMSATWFKDGKPPETTSSSTSAVAVPLRPSADGVAEAIRSRKGCQRHVSHLAAGEDGGAALLQLESA